MTTEDELKKLAEFFDTDDDTLLVSEEITMRVNADEYTLRFGIEELLIQTDYGERDGVKERETLIEVVPDGEILDENLS